MSLLGLAIVGKKNEPLYLCDCTKLSSDTATIATSSADAAAAEDASTPDPFGFLQSSSSSSSKSYQQGQSLEMEQQFILHAALDRLEEMVGASQPDGSMPLRKAVKGSSSGSKGHWLGLLTVQDEVSVVYGLCTATNIKFLALLEHPLAPTRRATRQALLAQDRAVQVLLTALHGHYVTYLLNPFSVPLDQSRIGSRIGTTASLDRHVRQAVGDYAAKGAESATATPTN
jgi:hypothetical protein